MSRQRINHLFKSINIYKNKSKKANIKNSKSNETVLRNNIVKEAKKIKNDLMKNEEATISESISDSNNSVDVNSTNINIIAKEMEKKCKIFKSLNESQKLSNEADLKRKRNNSDNSESKRQFISGISFKTTIDEFKILVKQLDINCSDVNVPFDEIKNTIKGFAQITSADVDSVYKLDQQDFNGRLLRVETAKSVDFVISSNKEKGDDKDSDKSDTLKLNDIDPEIDDSILKKFFGKIGKIRRIFNPERKNFAYVSFFDNNDTIKALKLNIKELGVDAFAELDNKKPLKSGESDTIKINYIDSNIDDNVLKIFFNKVGKIRRIFNPDDKNFAQISFDDANDAIKALKLNLNELGEDAKAELDVKDTQSKGYGSKSGRENGDRGQSGVKGGLRDGFKRNQFGGARGADRSNYRSGRGGERQQRGSPRGNRKGRD